MLLAAIHTANQFECLRLVWKACPPFLRLTCQVDDEAVKVCVEDDGPGVAGDMADRLFTPFDRLGQEDRVRVEGTGLGLSLSKSLIEAMGGQIGFEPLEQGSQFWFSLLRPGAEEARGTTGQHSIDETLPCQPS